MGSGISGAGAERMSRPGCRGGFDERQDITAASANRSGDGGRASAREGSLCRLTRHEQNKNMRTAKRVVVWLGASMSMEIHVLFRGKLPSKPALAKAMKE